jgi:hypothetical protein
VQGYLFQQSLENQILDRVIYDKAYNWAPIP